MQAGGLIACNGRSPPSDFAQPVFRETTSYDYIYYTVRPTNNAKSFKLRSQRGLCFPRQMYAAEHIAYHVTRSLNRRLFNDPELCATLEGNAAGTEVTLLGNDFRNRLAGKYIATPVCIETCPPEKSASFTGEHGACT